MNGSCAPYEPDVTVTITLAGCCAMLLAALWKFEEPGWSAGSWYDVS